MQITFENGRFVARCQYEHKDIVKAAGFRWNPAEKYWTTERLDSVERIMAVQGVEVSEELRAEVATRAALAKANLSASRATDANVELPVPAGLSYLPYQKAGIAYGASKSGVLIADDMGLGKTVQAIGIANVMGKLDATPVLIVCPASLKLNWAREWAKWSVEPMSIGIVSGTKADIPDTDVVIVNYDILMALREKLQARLWGLMIVDEAHYLKNDKTARTKALLGSNLKSGVQARRRVFLTGTPMPNRPKELWPLVAALDPNGLGANFFRFAYRYCAPTEKFVRGQKVTEFNGASHLDELQTKLRSSIMVRRLKNEVLTELPAKRRQIVPLSVESEKTRKQIEAELRAFDKYQALERALKEASHPEQVAKLNAEIKVAFAEVSDCRHRVAITKLPQVIEAVEVAQEAGKVIVMCHHADVVDGLMAAFGERAVKVDGRTKNEDRQVAVDRFQKDPTVTVFVGSIMAAGVGLTLTASSHVMFAELDWVPGNVTQAEDRAHRIGQRDTVLVQHLVLDGSLDARMAKTLIAKQEVIDQTLDREVVEAPAKELPKVLPKVERREVRVEVEGYSPERIAAIHEALRMLAGLDLDGAAIKNDVGFNKLDTQIGRSLAQADALTGRQAQLGFRIVAKYHRQLGPELCERCGIVLDKA